MREKKSLRGDECRGERIRQTHKHRVFCYVIRHTHTESDKGTGKERHRRRIIDKNFRQKYTQADRQTFKFQNNNRKQFRSINNPDYRK